MTHLTDWQRETAARIAAANPLDTPSMRFYRVQGDWHGGGFGYTMPFPSEAEARTWGEQKARFHRDTVITVIDRGPESDAARVSRAKCEAHDAIALRLQQMYPDPWGL